MNVFDPSSYINLVHFEREYLYDLFKDGTITEYELSVSIGSLTRIETNIQDIIKRLT